MTETKTSDYERGYREGFLDGFQAARDNSSLMSPNIPTVDLTKLNCQKCGIKLSNMTGFVCPDNHCPSQLKITC